uniref:Expression site-associated gene 9 (ESAG9) protein, putative n=1 Tax=Trypanosoma brucei brucei (strain 927/4 GUTat10.1) TaxID=185431 RepID=Q4FKD0_TRYB2|nr:expression site-associated gene 9 (ESAG9) protein, putative [Trypanosoma brucei brucei TREU927]
MLCVIFRRSSLGRTMLEVAITVLLTLRWCMGPAESRIGSVTMSGGGVTISSDSECFKYLDRNGMRVPCESSASSRVRAGRQEPPRPSAPQVNEHNHQRSSSTVTANHQQKQESGASSLSSTLRAVPDKSHAPVNVGGQVGAASGAGIRNRIEEPAELSSPEVKPRIADVGNEKAEERVKQFSGGEQGNRGSGVGESQNQGETVPPPEVKRGNSRDMSQSLPRRAVSLVEGESTGVITNSDLDEQESAENSTQLGRNTAHKRHVMMLPAVLGLLSS